MDIGIISVRYARALYKRSVETHCEDQVYAHMQHLTASCMQMPALRSAISNPMLSKDNKYKLLVTACGQEELCPVVERFITLVLDKGREDGMQYIANSYLTLYRAEKRIIDAKLTTAVPVGEGTEQKMRQLVEKRTNASVHFTTEVAPEIIGGFILEYDTYRLDASVQNKLNVILKQLKQ